MDRKDSAKGMPEWTWKKKHYEKERQPTETLCTESHAVNPTGARGEQSRRKIPLESYDDGSAGVEA